MIQPLDNFTKPLADSSGISASTDELLRCLETSIQRCRLILSDVGEYDPILVVVPIVHHLISVVLVGLLNRAAQYPFNSNGASTNILKLHDNPALRSQLLMGMIEVHLNDLQVLLLHLESVIGCKPGSVLEDAKTRLETLSEVFRDSSRSGSTSGFERSAALTL